MRTISIRPRRVATMAAVTLGTLLAGVLSGAAATGAVAVESDANVSCVDFDQQQIWLKGAIPEELTAPMSLGTVYVTSVSVETGDAQHNGIEIQPGERVTAFIGTTEIGTTNDIPDDDPLFRTQVFAVDKQLTVSEIRIVHAPIIAPDSVDVGQVCVTWLAAPPTTTTAAATTTTTTAPTSTTVATTTTVAATTTTVAATTTSASATTTSAAATTTSAAPTTTVPETIIEGRQELAFTGTGQTMLMLVIAIALIDIGYLAWSTTRVTRQS